MTADRPGAYQPSLQLGAGPWTLVEPCCGTAALTLRLLGARRQISPRQGSKWSFTDDLIRILSRHGFRGEPDWIVLSDALPWPTVIRELLGNRAQLLERLRPLVAEGAADPRVLHDRLHRAPVPEDPAQLAAELLWLQVMAFAGKGVAISDGRWLSPGLNETSAYGKAGTENFGTVHPLGPSLLRAVRACPRHVPPAVRTGLARPGDARGRVAVYLDPPYAGTTGYGPTLGRSEVVDLAMEWHASGATVLVSEAEPVAELVALGWESVEIGGQRPTQLFRARHRGEHVTIGAHR